MMSDLCDLAVLAQIQEILLYMRGRWRWEHRRDVLGNSPAHCQELATMGNARECVPRPRREKRTTHRAQCSQSSIRS